MAQKQTMIQSTPESAEMIATLGKEYGGASKSRDFKPLTQWEVIQGLLAFFDSYRWIESDEMQVQVNEAGEPILDDAGNPLLVLDEETGEPLPVLLDAFKPYADEILAARMETTRASATQDLAKLKQSLRDELVAMGMEGDKLEALLAKYGAA